MRPYSFAFDAAVEFSNDSVNEPIDMSCVATKITKHFLKLF